MSKPDDTRWKRTSPLATVFYLGKIFQAIAKNAVQSLAPFAAFLYASGGNLTDKIILGVAAFTAFVLLVSVVRYWFFRFKIADDSVLIREGVIKKTQLDLKFDRIQAVNTQQNLIYRYFDLVTVKFDTAGSAKHEGHLPAVSTGLATAIKAKIRAEGSPVDTESEKSGSEPARELLRLSNRDIIRIGLSNNRALIFLVFLGPIINRADESIERTIDQSAITNVIENSDITILLALGVTAAILLAFVLFLVFASIVGAFLRYQNFELVAGENVLRSVGGLLTRHEHTISLPKIQTLVSIQNPILRLFKRFRIRARQTSSGKSEKSKNFVIPLCNSEQLPRIDREVFGDEFDAVSLNPGSHLFERIDARFVRSRIVLFGVLPALLYTGPMLIVIGPLALIFLLWIPLGSLAAWLIYRKYGFIADENGIVLRKGFVGYRVTAFLNRKVQRISVTQSFTQKRKGLATIRFYLASGSLRLPYVDFEFAKKLRDYVLYRVESSQLAWF